MEAQLDPPRSSEEAVRRITGQGNGHAPSEELRRATTTLLAEPTPPSSSSINLGLQESRPADIAQVELIGPRGPWSFVVFREATALVLRTITGRQKKGDPDLFDIFGIKKMGEHDFDWEEFKAQAWTLFQIHILLLHLGPEEDLTTAQREHNEYSLWERWRLHLSRFGLLHIAERIIGGSLAAMVAITCLIGGWQYWHAPVAATPHVQVAADPRLTKTIGDHVVNAPAPTVPTKVEWNRLQPPPTNTLDDVAEEDPTHHAEIYLRPGVKGSTQFFPTADPARPETMAPLPFDFVAKDAVKFIIELKTAALNPSEKLDRVYAFRENEPAIYSYAKKKDGSRGMPLYEFLASESTRTIHVYRIMPIVDKNGRTVMTREQRVAGLKDPQTYYFPLLADIPNVRFTARMTVISPAGVPYPRSVTIGILPRTQ